MAEVPLLLRFMLVMLCMFFMGGGALIFALGFKLAFDLMALK
jgi:hypothetical protein